jgi:hypothetical protein
MVAELKYRKLFLNELNPEEKGKGFGRSPIFTVFADTDIIQGCNFFSAMIMGDSASKSAGHGPHVHKDPEVLVALGTDPEHPKELGGEIEIFMGPEMEKHIITESTIIFIPANFIHCPFRVTKVTRPFIFIQSQYSPKLNEKSLKKLVAEELRDKMVFIDTEKAKDI